MSKEREKNMKKMKKIICTILLTILIFTVFSMFLNNTYAMGNSIKEAANFVNHSKNKIIISNTDLQNFIIPIANLLSVIAIIVLVIVATIMGIKYVTTANNPDEQAKLKKQLIGLVVSAAVIFGAWIIWSTLYSLFSDL